ncbi:hypothetical protein, partial [Actinomadura sp. CNU-125]|uniref:hypothetical protein n=1 Tax=Actinomadura sp. CNU-125 TaxID=1904961 RepID=UPI0021CCDAE8
YQQGREEDERKKRAALNQPANPVAVWPSPSASPSKTSSPSASPSGARGGGRPPRRGGRAPRPRRR